jgi:hypothetical protein
MINAIIASKSQSESEKKIEEINTLSVDQLWDRYQEYFKIATEGTEELQKEMRDNKISILNLENYKNTCWYICFSFQSLGLVFGLVLVVLNKLQDTPSAN